MRERDDWDEDGYDELASGVASRAVTQGFVGTREASRRTGATGSAGSAWGRVETHCPGCLRAPWPDCACCGRSAIVALPDVETHHTLTLCGACWLLVLTVRMRPAPSHTRGHRLTPLQLAEITFLREWARLPWHEIAALVGASFNGVYRAYHRLKAPLPPMLDSTSAPTTPSVVPKSQTRQRPVASSNRVPTPTTKTGRTPRASATPSKSRKQQKRTQTRDPRPLSAEVELERPSVVDASAGKYNTARQERSTGRAAVAR